MTGTLMFKSIAPLHFLMPSHRGHMTNSVHCPVTQHYPSKCTCNGGHVLTCCPSWYGTLEYRVAIVMVLLQGDVVLRLGHLRECAAAPLQHCPVLGIP